MISLICARTNGSVSRRRWLETTSRSLWRYCNAHSRYCIELALWKSHILKYLNSADSGSGWGTQYTPRIVHMVWDSLLVHVVWHPKSSWPSYLYNEESLQEVSAYWNGSLAPYYSSQYMEFCLLIPAWISNDIHHKMWGEITYPFICTVEV